MPFNKNEYVIIYKKFENSILLFDSIKVLSIFRRIRLCNEPKIFHEIVFYIIMNTT